ncbi:MAG: hypothetical protein LBF40_01170 [Deltaproteobacteria bacterium]|nr:hypothetical protein [Deltaproteobacteria bacterium]
MSDTSQETNEVVRVYRNKGIDKAFRIMIGSLNSKKTTQLYSAESIEGHIFLKFVLILRLAIHKIVDENNLYKKLAMEEMLGKLNIIRKCIYPNADVRHSEITKKQSGIHKIFKIAPLALWI